VSMADYTGTSIPADQAWRIFGDWKSSGREIGAIFFGCSGTNILTMGVVESMRNGSLLLKSDTARVSFNLALANFTYGPFPTWPKWPYPPIVEMTAVRARMDNGDWLILADGLRPESFPSRALP
jgi:hypothetical protein